MINKPVAIVLGGTFPHIELIKKLQQRGYYAVLIDYYENPPAKNAADEHLRVSTLDEKRVLDIARVRNAKLVISTCIDQANVSACYVAEKLGLPAPYSYETALSVTNKGLMKDMMLRNGIPTSKYIFVNDIRDIETAQLNLPIVVKPADSNSSKGVRKACNYNDLYIYLESALKVSRNKRAVIEEYKEGKEIGIDCFVKNGEATILMTKERRKIGSTVDPIQQIYGCIWPADLGENTYRNLKDVANKIARAFKLNNTPLMIQAIIDGDDLSIIEFAPRIGGGESFRIIRLSAGFDIVEAGIDSFLGLQVNLEYRLPHLYYADNFIYARAGLFGHICGYEQLLQNGTVEYLSQYKTWGDEIGAEMSSNNRVGVFAVKAIEKKDLFQKVRMTIKQIQVCDVYGAPIMRKDIYENDKRS